jgi:hypothetical protein
MKDVFDVVVPGFTWYLGTNYNAPLEVTTPRKLCRRSLRVIKVLHAFAPPVHAA